MKRTVVSTVIALAALSVASVSVYADSKLQKADDSVQESVLEDESESESEGEILPDGEYTATFDTDSSMFHVNEALDGKGDLTIEDGKMTIHISLASKNIVNLYAGLADEAKKDEKNWIEPTEDEVTYSDGMTETVYGFDVPVEKLDKEFDLALLGKKGKWYDHKVSVSNPQKK